MLLACSTAAAQSDNPFDHVHVAVPDVERAREWYKQYLAANDGETPEAIAWTTWPGDHPLPVQILFTLSSDRQPSAGAAIEHIGFSVADLDASVEALRAGGATIVTPVSDAPGLGRRAVLDDPWGIRLVLLHDADSTGIHHIGLRVADVAAAFRWYAALGGEAVKYRGGADVVRFRGLQNFYLFAVADPQPLPAAGRAIDHLAFGPIELERTVAALTASGTTFVSNPNPRFNPGCRLTLSQADRRTAGLRRLFCEQPDALAHRVVYVEGPGGVAVELLQHVEAGGH